ncbi:hypothetical protein BpHYR1_020725 [Brachionus plicatilis]|uniref:Uncharacterized protein n=1 Tax=Brachionus plicatilis TaxID=10195 RepID=A0A3M7PCK4_BRAPC|nr:hypothetical protein BpHYR1_020725 [Brachionus plicatilis]
MIQHMLKPFPNLRFLCQTISVHYGNNIDVVRQCIYVSINTSSSTEAQIKAKCYFTTKAFKRVFKDIRSLFLGDQVTIYRAQINPSVCLLINKKNALELI